MYCSAAVGAAGTDAPPVAFSVSLIRMRYIARFSAARSMTSSNSAAVCGVRVSTRPVGLIKIVPANTRCLSGHWPSRRQITGVRSNSCTAITRYSMLLCSTVATMALTAGDENLLIFARRSSESYVARWSDEIPVRVSPSVPLGPTPTMMKPPPRRFDIAIAVLTMWGSRTPNVSDCLYSTARVSIRVVKTLLTDCVTSCDDGSRDGITLEAPIRLNGKPSDQRSSPIVSCFCTWRCAKVPSYTNSGVRRYRRSLRVYEHPLVVPQLSHFRHVPLRTSVNWPHCVQASPL